MLSRFKFYGGKCNKNVFTQKLFTLLIQNPRCADSEYSFCKFSCLIPLSVIKNEENTGGGPFLWLPLDIVGEWKTGCVLNQCGRRQTKTKDLFCCEHVLPKLKERCYFLLSWHKISRFSLFWLGNLRAKTKRMVCFIPRLDLQCVKN